MTPQPAPTSKPTAQCDVVMKGGITSGVVYPRALHELGSRYRICGIGGASAGAIGAAMGAAAEYGRRTGGFEILHGLPDEIGEGRLAELFQPQPKTRQLLDLMLVATGSDRAGPPRQGIAKYRAVLWCLITTFPIAGALGAALGVVAIVVGAVSGGASGALLIALGVVVALIGWILGVGARLFRLVTVDVVANRFGICSGLGTERGGPGFTDWLSERIDTIAGLAEAGPLTFGHLWRGQDDRRPGEPRDIDLRLITTCLTEAHPFEMPFEARRFFFDPVEWRELFPAYVVDALERAPDSHSADAQEWGDDDVEAVTDNEATDDAVWDWETEQASKQGLRRLPRSEDLPVIVATRMSLSFPLLISAVPLHTIDRRDASNRVAVREFRSKPGAALKFSKVWFTDGGLCSNFPVHLFDAALPSRPTFAINLGSLPAGRQPDADQTKNIEWAASNRSGLLPTHAAIPDRGLAAVTGFASAAFNTARNWQDSSHLDFPGYRDRIVRVLQSKQEGGMNLRMDTPTITGLAERGRVAAQVMVEQFGTVHYANDSTGWDNHRWVRYRALLSVLPDWIASFRRGLAVLEIDPANPPSYRATVAQRELADRMTGHLAELADEVARAHVDDPDAIAGLTTVPRPRGRLRRVPQI